MLQSKSMAVSTRRRLPMSPRPVRGCWWSVPLFMVRAIVVRHTIVYSRRSSASPGQRTKMGQIILARAGTTDFDEQDRIAGTLDLPLNVRGQAEVLQMAREMEGLPIERIFA